MTSAARDRAAIEARSFIAWLQARSQPVKKRKYHTNAENQLRYQVYRDAHPNGFSVTDVRKACHIACVTTREWLTADVASGILTVERRSRGRNPADIYTRRT